MIHSPRPLFSNCTSEERREKLSRYRNKKTKRNFGRKIKVKERENFDSIQIMKNLLINNPVRHVIHIYVHPQFKLCEFFFTNSLYALVSSMLAGRLLQTVNLESAEGLRRLMNLKSRAVVQSQRLFYEKKR